VPKDPSKFLFYLTRDHRISLSTDSKEYILEAPRRDKSYYSTLDDLITAVFDDDVYNKLSRENTTSLKEILSVIEQSRQKLLESVQNLKIS